MDEKEKNELVQTAKGQINGLLDHILKMKLEGLYYDPKHNLHCPRCHVWIQQEFQAYKDILEKMKWIPTNTTINNLAKPLRDYIHVLEIKNSSAALIQENAALIDQNKELIIFLNALKGEYQQLQIEVKKVKQIKEIGKSLIEHVETIKFDDSDAQQKNKKEFESKWFEFKKLLD